MKNHGNQIKMKKYETIEKPEKKTDANNANPIKRKNIQIKTRRTATVLGWSNSGTPEARPS